MNIGYEEDALEPHVEPPRDLNDPGRIGNLRPGHKSRLPLFLYH